MKFNDRNVQISPKASLGENVRIGDNTIIYDNVVIGDNTVIANNCVIGEPDNAYYHDHSYENPTLTIGADSLIRSHTIIYAGSTFGDGLQTGHRVTIRENVTAGTKLSVGTLSDLQGHCVIGDYCRFHSNVHIGQASKIGNFVFIYPFVVLTNDPHPPSDLCIGAEIGDYSQIAVHSILLPGVKVGKCCLIGANSTVNRDVEDESLAMGNPAKRICAVRDIPSKQEGVEKHYPWMYNFKRGMPWESIGYDEWVKENS